MQTAIWWIRRDLRLDDNQALQQALAAAAQVVPLFILDPAILTAATYSAPRFSFMLDGLRALDAALRARGSRLIVRQGAPLAQLQQVADSCAAGAIYAEEDYSPYARRRDAEVQAALPLHLAAGLTVRHPTAVEKQAGGHYTVFTPFKNAWLAQALPRRQQVWHAPDAIRTPDDLPSDTIPDAPRLPEAMRHFVAGPAAAQQRLDAFVAQRIDRYADTRDRMDLDGTSSLSPYLRFGMLSARQAVVAAIEARARSTDAGAQVWLDELIWREFYQMILYHHPHVRRGSYRPEYDAIAWRNSAADFDAWRNGLTGYPVVDAAMRQLKQSGWMHNRARMIVASFLTKDLLIDWRWGERWFMQHLLDGDHAANNGGWQWAAGTGTDAAPYFRIFNPTTQGQKFDPHGRYIRRWLPELAAVPDKYLHEPATLPVALQQRLGCIIGRDYPAPIVDHKWAREQTLAAYKAARREG